MMKKVALVFVSSNMREMRHILVYAHLLRSPIGFVAGGIEIEKMEPFFDVERKYVHYSVISTSYSEKHLRKLSNIGA